MEKTQPSKFPRLVFAFPFDERAAYEAESRGWLGYATVEVSSGEIYPVAFYSPVRLEQDLESEAAEGRPYIADPGMIVIPTITLAHMEQAVAQLYEEGYFKAFRSRS